MPHEKVVYRRFTFQAMYMKGIENRFNITMPEGRMEGDCGVSDPLLQRNARVSK
jgi:hypothetical protein